MDLSKRDLNFEFERTCQLLKRGYDIKEVAVVYHPRTAEQGKGLLGL